MPVASTSGIYQNYDKLLDSESLYFQQATFQSFPTQMDEHVLAEANKSTAQTPQLFSTPPIGEVVTAFEQAFAFFGLDYSIEVSDAHGFNFRPVHEERKIIVSKHLNMQFFSLDGEVKHELLHVIR